MPLVGMRRRTRVFGTRVLRSGKRSWSGQGGGKHREAVDAGAGHGELWIDLFNNPNSRGGSFTNEIRSNVIQSKENERQNGTGLELEIVEMDIDASRAEPKLVENGDDNKRDRMWGYVYQRKRKRVDALSVDSEGSSGKKKNRALECRRYGKQFVRKRRVKKTGSIRSCLSNSGVGSSQSKVLTVAVGSSSSWFACVLTLVLRYMRGTELRMSQLSAFLLSEPISQVFSSGGISFHYALDSGCIKRSGMCNLYEARCSIPLFDVDFSAVPSCFTYLHSSLHLRPIRVSYLHTSLHLRPTRSHLTVVACSETMNRVMTEVVEHRQCSSVGDSGTKPIVSAIDASEKKTDLSRVAIGAPKFTGRLAQFKNGVNFHCIQKKKRSLRCRRIKRLSVIIHNPNETNGSLVSNLFESRDDGTTMSSALSGQQQKTSSQKGSTPTIKEMKSLLVGLTQNIDSLSCSAHVLVIESHKCYRIKDAIVKLESLPSKQWFIAVKKDEVTRFSLSAQKVMRPCSNNRVTHDIIWTEDINNWKLEFLNRLDWMIFKELYKECFDRNLQAQNANVVFVPGVHNVTDYTDYSSVPFRRPMSYISVKADEVSRALVRRTANYDMDSEDEAWLQKLNLKSLGENVGWSNVSQENFELIIDSFEKASYCSPDDLSNEKAQSLCLDLERKEVVEAVYGYWVEKRKQKGVSLLRVFQPYKASRDRLLSKPVLRKKRSYKHQSSFTGRGKRLNLLQATMMLHNGVEQEVNPLSPSDESLTAGKKLVEQNVEEKKRMLKGREARAEAVRSPTVPDVFTSQKTTNTAAPKVVSRAQETRAAANKSESVAIEKRQKAQFLMEVADLATYRASIALRIAEAARRAEAAQLAVTSFLPKGYPDVD